MTFSYKNGVNNKEKGLNRDYYMIAIVLSTSVCSGIQAQAIEAPSSCPIKHDHKQSSLSCFVKIFDFEGLQARSEEVDV